MTARIPDVIPSVVGAGVGLVDGLVIHTDEQRQTADKPQVRTYRTLWRGGAVIAGILAEFLGADPRVSEALMVSGFTLLATETVDAISGGAY